MDDKGQMMPIGWKLSETIRGTRGCHIEAERRLLARSAQTSHANLYYGCWSAVLTLLTLDQRFAGLGLPAACFATTVALWAAYASAEKYELRARDFYCSYLQLQDLWKEAECAEALPSDNPVRTRVLDDVWGRYCQVLASTENHTEEDYINFLVAEYEKKTSGDATAQMTERQRRKRLWFGTVRLLRWAAIYLLAPAILLFASSIAAVFV